MPFFLKAEAGSAVSELLEGRLKRLQQQLDDSQKFCERLTSEVVGFTKAARDMSRSAGGAVEAFGAALDIDYARSEEAKVGRNGTDLEAESEATGGVSTRSSGATRNCGEGLRSELLGLQLIECATEMEEDLRAQVLEPMKRVLAPRSSIQTAVKERTRAAENVVAAHKDYARAVARYEPSAFKGDKGTGPTAELVQLGDRVVKASETFAEAHGRAEEVLSGLLEQRGRTLREAMASLKAAQAVFFVRAGHCVSSSVGQTPPPLRAQRDSIATSKDPSSEIPAEPLWKTVKLETVCSVEKSQSECPLSPATVYPGIGMISTADAVGAAKPEPLTPNGDDAGTRAANTTTNAEAPTSTRELPENGAVGSPNTPPHLFVLSSAATAESEDMSAPTEEGDIPAPRSGLRTASDAVGGKAGVTGGSTDRFESFAGASNTGGNKTKGDGVKNGGRTGPGVTLSETTRRRQTGWLKRLSMSFKPGHSRSRSSSGGDLGGLEPLSSPAAPTGGETALESSGSVEPPAAILAVDSRVDAVGFEPVDRQACDHLKHLNADGVSEAREDQATRDIDSYIDAGAGGEAAGAGMTINGTSHKENEKRRSLYIPLFGDSAERSRSGADLQHDVDLPVGEAQAIQPELDEPTNTVALQAKNDTRALGLPAPSDPAEESDESDSEETGSNTTEGFGSDAAGDLFEGSGGAEGFPLIRSPLPRSPMHYSGTGNIFGGAASADGAGRGDAAVDADVKGADSGGETNGITAAQRPREVPGSQEARGEGELGVCADPAMPTTAPQADVRDFGDDVNHAPAAEPAGNDTATSAASTDNIGTEQGGSVEEGAAGLSESETAREHDQQEGPKNVPPSAPPLQLLPTSTRLVRPPALASILPSTPPKTINSSPRSTTTESIMGPADVCTPLAALQVASPAPSESSSRESPRASWRLSGWWARASDRHRPPPPSTEESDTSTGSSLAATLVTAAAGGDAIATALSASGGLTPAFAGSGGDGRPALADDGSQYCNLKAATNVHGCATATTASPAREITVASAEAIAAAVAAERRHWDRSRRRRSKKPWLAADRLADDQARPLEAAREYLGVIELSRACGVCRAWTERLGRACGGGDWRRCVRRADGIPEAWRARFYLHVLYDQPAWLSRAHRRHPIDLPRPGVYRECLLNAEAEDEARKSATAAAAELRNRGNASPERKEGEGSAPAALGDNDNRMPPPPRPKCYKWLEEIDTDVLRTCPADATPGSYSTPAPATEKVTDEANISNVDRTGDGGRVVAKTEIEGKVVTDERAGETPGLSGGEVRVGMGTGESGDLRQEPSASSGKVATGGAADRLSGTESGGGTRNKLRRVLRAFAVHNPRVSYCQGMNFVALALLDACSGNDEQAFWILSGMCHRLDLEGLWCRGLERLGFCFFALDRLLKRHCPSLRQHLADEGVQLSMFTSRWFVTLFACNDVFGRGTSRKIMDMFFVEKWPLLFKVSLGVLLEMRPLLEPTDMEGILMVTKFPRAQLFGLRRDGTGRRVAGASFEEAAQGSLCESIRAEQMVDHALELHVTEETLEGHLMEYHQQQYEPGPGSD